MILQVNEIEEIGKRLDHYLVGQLTKYSRSRVQSFIRSGQILVNGNKCKTGYSLEMNDIIQVDVLKEESNFKKLIPENLNLSIIHEDKSIVVINVYGVIEIIKHFESLILFVEATSEI